LANFNAGKETATAIMHEYLTSEAFGHSQTVVITASLWQSFS
jgi:hypothetical protein